MLLMHTVITTMIPQSYRERNQDVSIYAQRLWWCITTSSSDMVNFTEKLVHQDQFYPHPVKIIAYELPTEKYVTIIKRFHKPVSCLQVYDDWVCKLYTTKRDGYDMFRIWHPTQREISKRTINDEYDSKLGGQRKTLWDFEDGIYRCFYDDDGNALLL
jgi:hypothetical protein